MAPRKESEPALSAPGLIGPMSIERPPMGGLRSTRRSRSRPYSHVRLEIDIDPRKKDSSGVRGRERRKGAASETRAKDPETFLVLAVEILHALSAREFRRVDSWAVRPDAAVPVADVKADSAGGMAVGDLIAAIGGAVKDPARFGRSFRAMLSDLGGNHVELALQHSVLAPTSKLRLDLTGVWTKLTVHALEGAIEDRLPVTRSEMVKFRFA